MDNALTYEQLDAKKTNLVALMAQTTRPDAVTVIGAQIELIEDLMDGLKPALPPTQDYYVLYKATWQPRFEDDDPPMDMTHSLRMDDERCTTYEMTAIGDDVIIAQYLQEDVASVGGEAQWYVDPRESGA